MTNRHKAAVSIVLDAKAIGRRIRAARKRRGWSIADLARVVGVAYSTLASWECGARVPLRDNLVALATALRRKVDWILFGTSAYWWRRQARIDPGPDVPERDGDASVMIRRRNLRKCAGGGSPVPQVGRPSPAVFALHSEPGMARSP